MKFLNKRKNFKRKLKQFKFNKIENFSIYLISLESGIINIKQIKSITDILLKKIKKKVKIFIKINRFLPITSKSKNIRMGKGKGKIKFICFKIKSGSILFKIIGLDFKQIINLLKNLKNKLPLKTKIVLV